MANIVTAEYKTAKHAEQKHLMVDVVNTDGAAGKDTATLQVGDVVRLTDAGTGFPYITAVSASPAVGDFIIAQGDRSLDYNGGHTPVEDGDYKFSPQVAATTTTNPLAKTTTKKRVALHPIRALDEFTFSVREV